MSEHECDGPDCCGSTIDQRKEELLNHFLDGEIGIEELGAKLREQSVDAQTVEDIWEAAERIRRAYGVERFPPKQVCPQLERYPGELEKLREYRRNARREIKKLLKALELQSAIAERAQAERAYTKERLRGLEMVYNELRRKKETT